MTLKRKRRNNLLVKLFAVAIAMGMFSCEEELEPWVGVTLQADCSLDSDVTYEGTSFTVQVESNTDWVAVASEWLTLDKTQGTGPGTVQVFVPENETNEVRSGFVRIEAGSEEPIGNIVGQLSQSFTVRQSARFEAIEITNVKVALQRRRLSNDYYDYFGTVTYTVSSDLPDEELAQVYDPELTIVLYGDNYVVPGVPYSFSFDISLSKGAHVVDVDLVRIPGNFPRCDIGVGGRVDGEIRTFFFSTNQPYRIDRI